MSIASEVERLRQAKTTLESALRSKGVQVPYRSTIDALAMLVNDIPVMTGEEAFLAAHPVGSIYRSTREQSPSQHGGTWKQVPSLGAFAWERTA